MWKNKRPKKIKLKFKDQKYLDQLAADLKTLHDIDIVDYKVMGHDNFSISFSRNFVQYYNKNKERLQEASMTNMVGALKQFPEEQPDTDSFTTMYYSTIVLSYVQETGKVSKIDLSNVPRVGDLIVTVEAIHDMMEDAEAEE